jgi:GTPase SAR1 family protein
MSDAIKVTGVVLPVGNGAVGKTSLALTLQQDILPNTWGESLARLKKTKNLEFEFPSDQVEIDGNQYRVVQQFLIPPGQRKSEGDNSGRSYEDVIAIYRFHIRRVDVVLLSYMITRLESFSDLEYWIHQVGDLCNDNTDFILVGTHLDMEEQREVLPMNVAAGKAYVEKILQQLRPAWRGECIALEVSNHSGANIRTLRHLISRSILRARGMIAPNQPICFECPN